MSFPFWNYLRALRTLDPPLPLLQRAVLLELVLRANHKTDDPTCYPSPARVARDVAAHPDACRKARRRLEVRGLIEKTGRRRGRGVPELRLRHPDLWAGGRTEEPTEDRTEEPRTEEPRTEEPGQVGSQSLQNGPNDRTQKPPIKIGAPSAFEALKIRHGLTRARDATLACTLRLVGELLDGLHEVSHNGERQTLLTAQADPTSPEHQRVVETVTGELQRLAEGGRGGFSKRASYVSAAILEWTPTAPTATSSAVLVGPHGDDFERRAQEAERNGDAELAQAWRLAAAP